MVYRIVRSDSIKDLSLRTLRLERSGRLKTKWNKGDGHDFMRFSFIFLLFPVFVSHRAHRGLRDFIRSFEKEGSDKAVSLAAC